MVLVAATIEDNCGDAGILSLLGNQFADLLCSFDLGAFKTFECSGHGGLAHQGDSLGVIDYLGNHMTVGTGDHQTRTLGSTENALAQAGVTTKTSDLLAFTENLYAHNHLPAFPALRRIRSSLYLMPLPL